MRRGTVSSDRERFDIGSSSNAIGDSTCRRWLRPSVECCRRWRGASVGASFHEHAHDVGGWRVPLPSGRLLPVGGAENAHAVALLGSWRRSHRALAIRRLTVSMSPDSAAMWSAVFPVGLSVDARALFNQQPRDSGFFAISEISKTLPDLGTS